MESTTLLKILAALLVIVTYIYYWLTKNFDYWTKRGVKGPKPIPFFGNFKDLMLVRLHQSDFMKKLYDEYYREPAIGLFFIRSPVMIVRDPEMIKDVLIKSFPTFADRGIYIHKDIEPLAQHLVFLEPSKWKPMRRKLTPVFTSGKLKEMFYLISDCANHFEQSLDKLASKGEPVDCRDLTAKFTTDVIGVCVFGLNMHALSDEDSEFRKIGRRLFDNVTARQIVRRLPHWAAVLLKPMVGDEPIAEFFISTIRQTMEHRRKNNIRRNDFVDLLMDIKDHPEKVGEEEMTDILLTAQAFVFFVAGFETSSSTISNALYELALNPDIQDKLRDEIKKTFADNGGTLNYDSVREMKYLNKVFKETLRKYPPISALPRKALEDHTFADTKISIKKGTDIFIPVYAIHHDENIYPNPEKFDPERFDEKMASTRHSMNYLPFGDGPRNCIGERFAQNQTKVGLAMALHHFKFEVCEKTCVPYIKNVKLPLLAPVGGIYLKIKKI